MDPSSELPSNKRVRRVRYQGKNPRQFSQKYKEHQPEQYAEDIAKIIAGGRTPAGTHRPIMVDEILQILRLQPGDTAIDCTLGYGGHSTEMLKAIQPSGRIIALDADPIEILKTEQRLRGLDFESDSLVVVASNFGALAHTLSIHAPDKAEALLADLGLSSMQIDDPLRGFSYKLDGPLDMRLNPQRGMSAANWLAKVSPEKLKTTLAENADEPQAALIANAICNAQSKEPLTTTQGLAEVIRQAMSQSPSKNVSDTIQRTFQAIRIAVNDEFEKLEALLRQIPQCIKSGGRIAILSFHSGEDRRVKQSFKNGLATGDYSSISSDIIRPSFQEQRSNPRSSSAKLRWAIKT